MQNRNMTQQKEKKRKTMTFELMHKETVVAQVLLNGKVQIYEEKFMPYDLYLDEEDENDIDILINNDSGIDELYHRVDDVLTQITQ